MVKLLSIKQDSANNSTPLCYSSKLATSGIIRVWAYEKVGRVIRHESESNTCILDEYGEY